MKIQYTVCSTQWNYGYMVVGTLSLVQKGQTSRYSGIVVYGGGDIAFGAKMSHSIHC